MLQVCVYVGFSVYLFFIKVCIHMYSKCLYFLPCPCPAPPNPWSFTCTFPCTCQFQACWPDTTSIMEGPLAAGSTWRCIARLMSCKWVDHSMETQGASRMLTILSCQTGSRVSNYPCASAPHVGILIVVAPHATASIVRGTQMQRQKHQVLTLVPLSMLFPRGGPLPRRVIMMPTWTVSWNQHG